MIAIVFRREMRSFFASYLSWGVFLAQGLLISGLMAFVELKMQHLYATHPKLATLMLTRNLSVLLVSFSLLSVAHIVIQNVTIEKVTGLIETLLTTPLTLRDLVWGKSLQIGVLGYGMGLLIGGVNSIVLLTLVGDVSLITNVAWYYWLFVFVAAPMIITGFLNAVIVATVALACGRVSVTLFTMLLTLLIFLGGAYQTETTEGMIMLGLLLIGIACHMCWWLCGNHITVERVVTS